jgi:FG-GAP-like repeat/FG-GAP repeat
LLVAAAAGAVVAGLAASSPGARAPAIVMIAPHKASSGDFIHVRGNRWAPSSRVSVYFCCSPGVEKTFLDSFATDAKGRFGGYVALPAVQRAKYVIEATDPLGHADTAKLGIGRPRPLEGTILTGPGSGFGQVRLFDADSAPRFAFVPNQNGGATVVGGDVNGDGILDIVTGVGAGSPPLVTVLSGRDRSILRPFYAYDQGFTGGVYVAAGDLNGDGKADIVTGAGAGGGPHVKVFSGADGSTLQSFFAFDPAFTGGVRVAVGDVNGNGFPDIVVGAGPGGGPQVKVFSGKDGSVLDSFFGFDSGFTGGVFVAAGDLNGDGKADIVTGAGAGGGPQVKVFSGKDLSVLQSFFAYDAGFTGGVYVAAGDVNGDGHPDLVTGAGAGGGPHVKVFAADGSVLQSFFAYDPAFTGGVTVGVR